MLYNNLLYLYLLLLATTTSRLSSLASKVDTEEVVDIPHGTLHNGVKVPLVGLGCASGVRQKHVSTALNIGYRFLDTAQSYTWGYHEDEVGTALRNFNSNNEIVFLQTKIHPEELGYEATKKAIQQSLQRLQVKTINSVLIHKPHCWPGACNKEPEGTWQESWKAMEELYNSGIISHSIGICDVTSEELLNELLSQRIKPHIIQNWMDPLHQDTFMRRKIQGEGILYQAYSSLGTQWYHHKGHSTNPVLNHPVLMEIANAHRDVGADVGQVVINWATTHGVSVLPASTNPKRQEGNLYDSFRFSLSEEELNKIDNLDGNVPKNRSSNEISIKFRSESFVNVYWIGHDGNEEVPVGSVEAGKELGLNTFHGHTFRFRDNEENVYSDHTIEREEGSRQVYVIEPVDEDEL